MKIFNKKIKENFDYEFEIKEDGLYAIEIIASCKNWLQNLIKFTSFFKDDDLTVKIDNVEFPKLNGKRGLFDGEAAWNGNNLKGLKKTDIFLIRLEKGNHAVHFLIDQEPYLESVNIYKLQDPKNISYTPESNNPPEDGNRRQWLTIVLCNLGLQSFKINALAKKGKTFLFFQKDDSDLKLIIDGQIQRNEEPKSHKFWYWCGRILKGKEKTFEKELNLKSGLHFLELWVDRSPEIKEIKFEISEEIIYPVFTLKDIRTYTFKGISGTEDYNRFDKEILDAVNFWNKFFFSQKYPPKEALNPNLVKAMIYIESRMGYEKGGYPDIAQVGNENDPALHVLNNDGWVDSRTGEIAGEYEWQDGQIKVLDYDGEANASTPEASIKWGVRWLYHKAQWMDNDGKRHWNLWKDAVKDYGPGTKKYADNVWNIYLKGIDNRSKPPINLWLFIFFIIIPTLLFSFFYSRNSLKSAVVNTIDPERRIYIQDVKINPYWKEPSLFSAIIEWDKDWWEDLKVGSKKGGTIKWFEMKDLPTEQSILEARFLNLKGFDNPVVEVYGKTHAGHGALYLYEIRNNRLELLLKTQAVDFNSDIRWLPDNYKKYGYRNCGEIFSGGRLLSNYEDLNKDGISDIVLSGTEEIICEKELEGRSPDGEDVETKVADIQIRKIFLWDKNENSYVEK